MNQVDINNAAHYEALKVVENAVKNGVKITKVDTVEREPWIYTINPKTVKHIDNRLMAMPAEDRFKDVIKMRLQLTRGEVSHLIGINASGVSAIATKLIKDGYIKKITVGKYAGGTKKQVYSYAE